MADGTGSAMNNTGLSDEECKEIHTYFTRGTTMWALAALVAHMLVWVWKPWFPIG